jgi:hypothetical protein
MSTHSPGPWVFDESDHSIYCGDDWPCVASFSDADLPSPANGRLMAAAPELLAALELLLRKYGGSIEVTATFIAREAIRKARGEQ